MELEVVDVFCGGGGLSQGFEQAGFKISLGIDMWGVALQSFGYNHNEADVLQADITKGIDLPRCRILIGSPPCPEFSVAKQIVKRTFDMSCVNAFLALVNRCQPEYWIMENVPELVKHLKIDAPYQIIKACGYGLQQRRRRVFFGTLPPKDFSTSCRGHHHIPAITATEWKGRSSEKNRHKMNRYADYLNRKPTIEECKREMGFPAEYKFFGSKKDQYIQIGNAVVPPVAKILAEAIKAEAGSN